MQFPKKGSAQTNKNNLKTSEYEIKTFGTNMRNRSPMATNSYYARRSPVRGRDQGTIDSNAGEMMYLEPNEVNFHRNEEGGSINNNYIVRSPGGDEKGGGVMRMEYERRAIDTSQQFGYNPSSRMQKFSMEIDQKKERFSRSPQTINIGESPKEVEYNMRTLNRGRSPKFSVANSPQDNQVIERSYNIMSNETGNIFLDQPMQQGSFVRQTDIAGSPALVQNSYEMKNSQEFGQNSREMRFAMNPRDLQEPMPGILNKMSPQGNVEGDSDSNSEKNDNVNQIKDLKTQLDRRSNVILRPDDGMTETRVIPNELDKIEDLVKSREMQDTITGEEVKKLVRQYVKAYDPHKGEDGNLISNSQTVVQSAKDELFNDRYKVLQKMNKLSSILLSKKQNTINPNEGTLNRSFGDKTFDKNTLNSTVIGGKKTIGKRKANKFLYVSLAMLSSKGLNTEDRTILRRMRIDKGGVVDLAQEQLAKKEKFKIKKVKASGRGHTMINHKYKEKAAKIVQAWWRERKQKYKKILDQIIKIQSVWRGKFTRKYVYDIIYMSYLHQKFFDIMSRVLVQHIRPQVWDDLFSRKKLAKETLSKLLEKNDSRFSALRLKPYFLKWDAIANFLKRRILTSKRLVIKKGDDEQRKKILKKYLDQWALRSNLEKYIGKAKDAEERKQKFFGTIDLINGLSNLTKRTVQHNTKEPIQDYLKSLLRKKLMTKIIDNTGRRHIEMIKRRFINKWKDAVHKGKYKDLKNDVFTKGVTRVHSRMDKIKMKKYLDRWRRQIPQGKKILDINDGAEILRKFTLRTTFMDPLAAMSEKCDNENLRQTSLKLIIMKRRNLKDNLRDYLNRWKNNTIRLDDKDYRNSIFTTLLKNLIDSVDRRILYKRFNQWRQRPKIDVNKEMSKIISITDVVKEKMKSSLFADKKTFFDRLRKTKADHAVKNAGGKILKNYNRKGHNLLRYYFYKWRNQVKKYEISDLHKQFLRYLINDKENMDNRNKMARYLTRWRLFVSDSKNYDNLTKLKKAIKGGDILSNLHHRRIRNFITRMYRKMGIDHRPKIIYKLAKELEKPRSTLRECFDRWRRLNERQKATENITNIKGRFVSMEARNISQRTDRDKLMKAFFKWKVMCRKPEEYYPKITRGLNILNHKFKNELCKEPFDKLTIARNFTRPMNKIIKNYKNQEKRLLNGKMRNLLGRWRKLIGDINVKEIKTNMIYKTKNYLDHNLRTKLLAKYFTRWKLYRRKGLDVNFGKGIDKLTELYKRPFRRDIFNAFKNKIDHVSKQKGAGDLAKVSDKHKKHLLHNALYRWYRGAMNTDPNRMKKIKTRLRRFIKRNEKEPRAKAFFKWKNKIKLMQFRDKDLDKAKKMIGNALRANDRKMLNYGMSTWKKKIQLIREQYLKSLLVKQIKSSQMIKEEMNNQSRLRSALLKWRSKLVPIDYLERLKNIRKGCKIFKKGLRKRDELQIFTNIHKLAEHNRKKYLLKDIILNLNPTLAKYHLKRCIDVWVSKLGDTQRMKNKIHTLFEDYVYSDKVHEGLFKEPKDLIIDLLNKRYNDKKEAAKKIADFTSRILDLPKQINNMKAILKLRNIVDNKDKELDDIKKMQFIRLYRQTQKVKNDQNAKIIQKFIKEKLRRYFDKRKLINKGVDIFNIFLKKIILRNIADKAKDNHMKKVLFNGINRQENANKKILRDTLNKWRDKLPLLRQNEAADKIISFFRTIKAKNKLKNLRERIIRLTHIYENYDDRNQKKLYSHLHEWLHRALMIKNNQNAKIIQNFCKYKMNLHNKKVAQQKIKKMVTDDMKHKLAVIMERASRIIGGKGEVVYKALQDILYRNPFDKFIDRLKFTSRVNTLRRIQPKIHEKLKKHFLPLALKKWKENTYDVTVRQTKIMQKFLRNQYLKKMARDKERRELLLKLILQRLIKNNKYKLQLPFNIWNKKTKLSKVNECVNKIQNAYRKHIANEKLKDLSTRDKWKKLIRLIIFKKTSDGLHKAGDYKNIRNLRKKILYIILRKKASIDDLSSVQKCFEKWRRYNQRCNDCATSIANAYRIYKAKKEKNRLRRINDILKKTVNKHIKTDNDQMRSKLRKWNNKAKLTGYNANSRIIQRFIRPKLAKLLNDRFKKYFHDNAHKKTNKLLLLVGKIYRLQHALNRPSVQRFLNNLKKITKHNKINDKLTHIVSNKDSNYKNLLLKKYLQRWKDQKDKIGTKEYESACTIQRAFLSAKARAEKNRLLRIKKILIMAVLKKSNITNNKLYSYFTKWLNIARILSVNENARIIQEFCRQIQGKLNQEKELSRKLRINNGLDKLFNIKFGKKYFFDKFKSVYNRYIFKKFNDDLKNRRTKTLKEVFDKIKKTAFDNKLRNVLKVPDKLRIRILKKTIQKWKDSADKLKRKRGAEILQKNIRLYLLKKRQENKKQLLQYILRNLIQKHSNIKEKYFNKWKDNADQLKNKFSKIRVVKYIVNKYRVGNARKNWNKLAKNLVLQNRNGDLFTVVDRMKRYKLLNRFKKPFNDLARIIFLKKIEEITRRKNEKEKLKDLVPKREKDNRDKTLRHYLNRWIEKTNKINQREDNLRRALDALTKRNIINDSNKINSCILVKKLFHDIPYARAKLFMEKLKANMIKKNKYTKLSKDLGDANDNIKNQNKQKLMHKLYKIYAYKKIDGLVNACKDYDKNIIKPIYGKDFLKKLFINMTKHSQYNYADKQESTNKANITKFHFKKTAIKPKNIIEDKQAPIKRCLPGFIAFLDHKIKETNKNSFDEIKRRYTSNKFCLLLKKFSNKKIIPPKEDLVGIMRREVNYSKTRPIYQVKLFKLLRKKYIKEITTKLEEPSRLYKLFYLVNVTRMHQNISHQRFFRELIRKWRFVTFTKKMARKKLELMYKNFHASYLQMADEIFGDNDVNPSVFKEFESFGNSVGMFTGQEPEIGEELNKKYYMTVDKKYVFNKTGNENENLRKTFSKNVVVEQEEEEEVEKVFVKRPSNELNKSFKEIQNKSKYFKKSKK